MTTTAADRGLGFILQSFVDETDGVRFAQTVSADGMHLAASSGYTDAHHETFAAIASGLASLTDGAVGNFGLGKVTRQIIEASDGWILVARVSPTASMGVVADAHADLGMVGYEMTLLTQRLGDVLSPELIERLKNVVAPVR
jgi:predicted regulator of Ras-like GTPase activity (Roadblock/LC7/MglB family)